MFGFHRTLHYERLVIFSVGGRYKGLRGPGLVFVRPILERVTAKVDLREVVRDIPDQGCITKDNVPVTIDPIVFYRISDPEKTVLTIRDASAGILNVARTTLRAVVGDMELSDVTAKREQIAQQLKMRLSQEAERWGIEVTTVEIADLKLQDEVAQAMANRKAEIEKAEAERRSVILKAEGDKEAARSEKDAILTRAEAEKSATILHAEGEKEAQILRAEGLAAYYQKLIDLGQKAEIALRFENIAALRSLAESKNSKLVIITPEAKGLISGGAMGLKFLEDILPKKEEP